MNEFTPLTPVQNKSVKYWQKNGRFNFSLYMKYLQQINTQPKTQFAKCQKAKKN